MEKLTAKQKEIYEYIKDYIRLQNFPPTVRDICRAVGLSSTSSVHAHLNSLEEKGYIKRDPAKPRTIIICDEEFNSSSKELANVPMVGNVAAGQPILAEENITDYFPIPVEYLPNSETFMLKVRGDSMVNVGIFDGDNVIVEKKSTASNGEIVVAMVEDGATVKRFFKENGHYRLQPENDYMEPIIVEKAEVLGRVIGLIRILR